jgi:hypothetical protein
MFRYPIFRSSFRPTCAALPLRPLLIHRLNFPCLCPFRERLLPPCIPIPSPKVGFSSCTISVVLERGSGRNVVWCVDAKVPSLIYIMLCREYFSLVSATVSLAILSISLVSSSGHLVALFKPIGLCSTLPICPWYNGSPRRIRSPVANSHIPS